MPVTIRDVAKRLNLSITTVSRALDGYGDVAPETRERVLQAVREMGYAPDRVARQLRRRVSETIGYILPTSTPRFNDPYFSTFIAGIGNEAALHNYDLLVSLATPGEETERELYQRWVQGRKVDGFILNRMQLNDWRVQYLSQEHFPFVSLERSLDGVEYDSVEVDGQAGLMELMAYLVGKGHRRIAYIGGPQYLTLQADRFSGYREGLASAGIPFGDELVLEGDMTRTSGYIAAQEFLDSHEPPTAITCVNDLTAIGVLQAARERNLGVGQSLAIAGFDGIEEAESTQPPLTTLYLPVFDVASRLATMLLARIAGETTPAQRVRLTPKLVIRQSTGG